MPLHKDPHVAGIVLIATKLHEALQGIYFTAFEVLHTQIQYQGMTS